MSKSWRVLYYPRFDSANDMGDFDSPEEAVEWMNEWGLNPDRTKIRAVVDDKETDEFWTREPR